MAAVIGDDSTKSRDDALALWGKRTAVVFGTWRQPRPKGVTHRLIWHKTKAPPGVTSSAYYSAEEEVYLIGTGWTRRPSQTR